MTLYPNKRDSKEKREEENSDEVIEEHLSELTDMNFQVKSVSHCECK